MHIDKYFFAKLLLVWKYSSTKKLENESQTCDLL
jgi:hypothetical protein